MGVTAGTYTVSATLSGRTEMAMVRVLGMNEPATMFSIAPPGPLSLVIDGTQSFTVTLDIPAPPGGDRRSTSAKTPAGC